MKQHQSSSDYTEIKVMPWLCLLSFLCWSCNCNYDKRTCGKSVSGSALLYLLCWIGGVRNWVELGLRLSRSWSRKWLFNAIYLFSASGVGSDWAVPRSGCRAPVWPAVLRSLFSEKMAAGDGRSLQDRRPKYQATCPLKQDCNQFVFNASGSKEWISHRLQPIFEEHELHSLGSEHSLHLAAGYCSDTACNSLQRRMNELILLTSRHLRMQSNAKQVP